MKKTVLLSGIAAAMVSFSSMASDVGMPSEEQLSGLYPGKAYSPYAKRNFPSNVY